MKFILLLVVCVSFSEITDSFKIIPPKQLQSNDPKSNNVTNDTLIFAHVLFRHGERNIIRAYPNDPFNDEFRFWPGGFGQLTNTGKMQLYRLGKYLKKRYQKLLGEKYSPNTLYVRSTDYDRTLMSSQANLAGLFEPTEDEKWNNNILWQPIPVHTVPRKLDHIVSGERLCPKFEAAFEKFTKESKEVRQIYDDYGDLFSYWSKMCGSKISSIRSVYELHNTLMIEQDRNMTLQDWAKRAIEPNGPMEIIAKFNFITGSANNELARLKSGFLLKDILDRFSHKIDKTLEPNYSLWFYSAHDFTISSILNSLGLFELHFPPYASSVHFELFKTRDDEHYIQIFYRKSNEENPLPLNVPGCGTKCTIKQFYELYEEIIPGDFESECSL